MLTVTHPDACPVCDPGIPDAALPLTCEAANGGTVTSHECGSCGSAWSTFWDRYGFPIDRLLAPVSPDRAAGNRTSLDRSLRRSAA